MTKAYLVSMPVAGSACLRIGGVQFKRGTSTEKNVMRAGDDFVRQLKSYGFTLEEVDDPQAEELGKKKRVRLISATDEQLDAALIKANLPADGSREDKIATLRQAGVAFVRKV